MGEPALLWACNKLTGRREGVRAGVHPDGAEYGLEGLVERGGEEVAAGAEIAEAIDDEGAARAKDVVHGAKGLAGHEV